MVRATQFLQSSRNPPKAQQLILHDYLLSEVLGTSSPDSSNKLYVISEYSLKIAKDVLPKLASFNDLWILVMSRPYEDNKGCCYQSTAICQELSFQD